MRRVVGEGCCDYNKQQQVPRLQPYTELLRQMATSPVTTVTGHEGAGTNWQCAESVRAEGFRSAGVEAARQVQVHSA